MAKKATIEGITRGTKTLARETSDDFNTLINDADGCANETKFEPGCRFSRAERLKHTPNKRLLFCQIFRQCENNSRYDKSSGN
jgi:hypothetical protein